MYRAQQYLRSGLAIAMCVFSLSAPTSGNVRTGDLREADDVHNLIAAAWKTKQERVKAAIIEWREHEFRPKREGVTSAFGQPIDASESVSPTDTEQDISRTLIISGNRTRYTYHYKLATLPNSTSHPNQDMSMVSVFDGDVYKSLRRARIGQPYPQGTIEREGGNPDRLQFVVKPAIWSFRPADTGMNTLALAAFVPLPDRAFLDSRECLVLEEAKSPDRSARQSLWIDTERDYSIVRYLIEDTHTGNVIRQMDISYQRDAIAGWIPSKWKAVAYKGKSLLNSVDATVTGYAINPDIDPSQFDLAFPAGTIVFEEGRDGQVAYLLRQDRTKRVVTNSELISRQYDDLLRRDSYGWVALGLVGIAVVAIAMTVMSRWLMRRKTIG
jgi:hypothetical protein